MEPFDLFVSPFSSRVKKTISPRRGGSPFPIVPAIQKQTAQDKVSDEVHHVVKRTVAKKSPLPSHFDLSIPPVAMKAPFFRLGSGKNAESEGSSGNKTNILVDIAKMHAHEEASVEKKKRMKRGSGARATSRKGKGRDRRFSHKKKSSGSLSAPSPAPGQAQKEQDESEDEEEEDEDEEDSAMEDDTSDQADSGSELEESPSAKRAVKTNTLTRHSPSTSSSSSSSSSSSPRQAHTTSGVIKEPVEFDCGPKPTVKPIDSIRKSICKKGLSLVPKGSLLGGKKRLYSIAHLMIASFLRGSENRETMIDGLALVTKAMKEFNGGKRSDEEMKGLSQDQLERLYPIQVLLSNFINNCFPSKWKEKIASMDRLDRPTYNTEESLLLEVRKKGESIYHQTNAHKRIYTQSRPGTTTAISDVVFSINRSIEELSSMPSGDEKRALLDQLENVIKEIEDVQTGIAKQLLSITSQPFHIPSRFRFLPDLSFGSSSIAIPCINTIDQEDFPRFKWINSVFEGDGVEIVDNPLVFTPGCSCGTICSTGSGCECIREMDGVSPYDVKKRLKREAGFPVYECNSNCTCDLSCQNRVVQHGQQLNLTVFKTPDRGWAVRTEEDIPKATFVTEYVGEMISSEVAERRGMRYDRSRVSYLMDLDVEGRDNRYCIDAMIQGNTSRFFNHSCLPNLVIYYVWIDNLDKEKPRIAFFSKRDIKMGEELTFDYKYEQNSSSRNIPCRCGAPKCRKFLL